MTELLKILDRSEIQSKEHFMLACATAGIEIDDAKYADVVNYEIGQLKNIKKIEHMFDEHAEESLFCYKKMFKLVEYANVTVDDNGKRTFSAKTASDGTTFNMSLDLMADIQLLHGIDPNDELWNLLKTEILKR